MIQHGFCIPNLLNKYIFCHNFVFMTAAEFLTAAEQQANQEIANAG